MIPIDDGANLTAWEKAATNIDPKAKVKLGTEINLQLAVAAFRYGRYELDWMAAMIMQREVKN